MSEITNFKCPACTGPLRYDGEKGRLVCDYCDSEYEAAEIEALYAEKISEAEPESDLFSGVEGAETAAEAPAEAEPVFTGETEIEADDSSWGSDAEGMKVYSCPSCGAELICPEETAATFCPYCGNNTIIPGQLGGKTLRPDLIIPFKLDRKQAIEALKNHYKGKLFLPKLFKKENHIQKIQGIYVPFWLFDGMAEADVEFSTTRSHIIVKKNEDVTVTEHFNVHRAGTLEFEKVPTDASSKMPDDLMDSIEPFDYSELKEFSAVYLPGFFADKYDVTVEECTERADRRVRETALACMQESVVGYETCVLNKSHVDVKKGRVHYALLPVWMLNTKWRDGEYMFAMNGQTGKIVGNLPVDKGRFAATFFGIALPLMAALGLLLFLVM